MSGYLWLGLALVIVVTHGQIELGMTALIMAELKFSTADIISAVKEPKP